MRNVKVLFKPTSGEKGMFNLEKFMARKHSQDFDFCSGGASYSSSENNKVKRKKRDDSDLISDDFCGGYTRSENYTDPTQPGRDMTILMGDS